jgi:hypothetical protein
MDSKEIGVCLAAVALMAVIIAAIYGYIANIVALFHSTGDITGQFILRVVGIFIAPLGSILGFL